MDSRTEKTENKRRKMNRRMNPKKSSKTKGKELEEVDMPFDSVKNYIIHIMEHMRRDCSSEIEGIKKELKDIESMQKKLPSNMDVEVTAFIQLLKTVIIGHSTTLGMIKEFTIIFQIYMSIFSMLFENDLRLASTQKDLKQLRKHIKENHEPIINSLKKTLENNIQERQEAMKRGIYV